MFMLGALAEPADGTMFMLNDSAASASPIDAFLLRAPQPTSTDVVGLLQPYSDDDRFSLANELIARGVPQQTVSSALAWLNTSDQFAAKVPPSMVKGVLTLVSAAASAFHGIRRNKGSIGWGVWWFGAGLVFPVFTPVVALAQGFGKPKGA